MQQTFLPEKLRTFIVKSRDNSFSCSFEIVHLLSNNRLEWQFYVFTGEEAPEALILKGGFNIETEHIVALQNSAYNLYHTKRFWRIPIDHRSEILL